MDKPLKDVLAVAYYYGIELDKLPDSDTFMRLLFEMNNNQRKWVLKGNKSVDIAGSLKPPHQMPFIRKNKHNDKCSCGCGKKHKK